MKKKDHVIIIPGLLRCVDRVFYDFMNSAADLAQVFVVTEKSYALIAHDLVSRYNANCIFMEDVIDDFGVNPANFQGAYNQVLKLEVALKAILDWEAAHDHQFKYIHKFRSDLLYNSGFLDYIQPLLSSTHPEKCLLNQHDCNFSGLREDFLKLIGISAYLERFTRDQSFFDDELIKIDVHALRSGDIGPFISAFPVGVLSSESEADAFNTLIREKYSSYIDAALDFAIQLSNNSDPHDALDILRSENGLARTYIGPYFPFFPEHIYARYVNSLGLSTQAYSTPHLPLRNARFATTAFTKLIFDLIQENNFSFLDDDVKWKEEVDKFRSSGGIEAKFILILTSINLLSLSDSQCYNLYSLLDCLDCTAIVRFWPWFISNMRSRGLDFPSSIKSLLEE